MISLGFFHGNRQIFSLMSPSSLSLCIVLKSRFLFFVADAFVTACVCNALVVAAASLRVLPPRWLLLVRSCSCCHRSGFCWYVIGRVATTLVVAGASLLVLPPRWLLLVRHCSCCHRAGCCCCVTARVATTLMVAGASCFIARLLLPACCLCAALVGEQVWVSSLLH